MAFFHDLPATLVIRVLRKWLKSVRHESAIVLAVERAVEKVLTQHISYPALGLFQ